MWIESMIQEFEGFIIGFIPNGNISLTFNLVCFMMLQCVVLKLQYWYARCVLYCLMFYYCIQSAPVCSGSVSLQDIYNSSHMLGPIEVTSDNQDNSISFMIPSSRVNLNRFYNATFTLVNSAGSAIYNINISKLLCYMSLQSMHIQYIRYS